MEESNEEIASDISRDSFLREQLPEASFELEPTRQVPPRIIQTRTQTALEQGIPHRRFSQFGYPSESESEAEAAEPPHMNSPFQVVFPELDDLEPLFSDQEEIQPPTFIESLIPLPSGTSFSLLSNPSLTDTLSKFPPFYPQTRDPNQSAPSDPTASPHEPNIDLNNQIANQNSPPKTFNRRRRPKGRPPARQNQLPTSSSGTTTSSRRPTTRLRRGPRTRSSTRASPRIHDRAMTLLEIPESPNPTQPNTLNDASRRTPRYQLRANRAPRYRCGTCGSRNCSCIQLITTEPPNLRLAREAAIPARELTLARAQNHRQHEILTVRAEQQKPKAPPTIRDIILTIEKTYASTESGLVPPLETTLKEMHKFSPSNCPTYRFKEWTNNEKGELEFPCQQPFPLYHPHSDSVN